MSVESPETTMIRFGPFELDLRSAELRKDGIPTRLQPQPARVLALLARRAGQLVSREEIRRQIWGDHTFVDFEQGLNFCIKQIRAALGDDAEQPRYIETLPRRGYRFVAPVQELNGAGGAIIPPAAAKRTGGPLIRYVLLGVLVLGAVVLESALILSLLGYLTGNRPRPRPPEAAGRLLIAVLPFENLSGGPDQEYLSDGLTEEMITRLGGFRPESLGVIARTSAMQYKHVAKGIDQIGRELGVDYVLEGSVRRAGNRVRISAQLVRVRDQTHLWAQNYERSMQDVLAVQADVARAIAGEISVRLDAQAPGRSSSARQIKPEAYEAYLKGRYYCRGLSGGGVEKGIEYLQRAIKEDPGYAPSYAALAEAYYALSNMQLNPREAMTKAKAAATRALEIDGTLAEAHAALGVVKAFYEWDWRGAENEFKRALELDPGWAGAQGWYGAYLALMGRLDESRAELERARKLDPLSLSINWTMGLPLYLSGQYDQVIEEMRKTLELDPNFYLAHISLGLIYETRGEPNKAIDEFRTARELDDSPEILAYIGRSMALAGRRAEAERIIGELQALAKKRYVSPYDLAIIYAGLGEKDRTLACLREAYENRSEGMVNLKTDPRMDGLRSDPRFQDLLRLMNFPP